MEHENIKHAIFTLPKVYLLELQNGTFISKRKGFNFNITKDDFFKLYNSQSIQVTDER